MQVLEWEKPVIELEEKIRALREEMAKGALEDRAVLDTMEKELDKLKKALYSNLSAWQKVQLSRHPNRPYAMDYIQNICDDFIELHGDRYFGDDKALIGGLAMIAGKSLMIIGQQKGRTTKERQFRNFGMPNPEGYRKARRLMKIAEQFSLPVLTLIDTPGAAPGLGAEERGQAEAIAQNLLTMSELKVPIISIVIGEGASGGALGIGVADMLLMMENTWFSVISPESCSSILWRSWDYKEKAAQQLELTPESLLKLGIIDEIIPEPLGGAHRNPNQAYQNVKEAILRHLKKLKSIPSDRLVRRRKEKYYQMGQYIEKSTS